MRNTATKRAPHNIATTNAATTIPLDTSLKQRATLNLATTKSYNSAATAPIEIISRAYTLSYDHVIALTNITTTHDW